MKYLTSFLQFLARITATFGKMTSFIAHSSPRTAMQCYIKLSKNAKKLYERGWTGKSSLIPKKGMGQGPLSLVERSLNGQNLIVQLFTCATN